MQKGGFEVIRLIIIVFGLIMLWITGSAGDWGPFALCLIIMLALLGMGSAERKDAKAYINCRNYWLNGGPDKK